MKNNFRILCLSFVCLLCILLNVGCSCNRPISVKYTITAEGNAANYLTVNVVMYQKYREPIDTPCYKKMSKGFIKLETPAEIQACIDSECYKKVGKEYVLIESSLDISKCLTESLTCYEKVEETYYKLIEDPEGISACYDAEGNAFERATYSKLEKNEISTTMAISTRTSGLSYESELVKLSSKKSYSYLYEFKITNDSTENININIKNITYNDIVGESIVEESKNKVKVSLSKSSSGENITLAKKETLTVSVEVKYMTKADIASDIVKDLNLNIPIVANV